MAAMTSCENTLLLFTVKGAIYYVAIAKVIFSRVKISCFRAKAHLVFHWCLYYKKSSYIKFFLKKKIEGHGPILPAPTENEQCWVGRGEGDLNESLWVLKNATVFVWLPWSLNSLHVQIRGCNFACCGKKSLIGFTLFESWSVEKKSHSFF